MNIEDEKKRFADLLYASYQASLVKNAGYEFMVSALTVDPSRLYISGNTLEKFGFDYRDSGGFFWSILCPSLQAEGYLTEYTSFSPMSEQTYLANFTESPTLIQRRDSLATMLPREQWQHANNIASGKAAASENMYWRPSQAEQKILDEIEEITRKLKQIKDEQQGNITHEFVVDEKKLGATKSAPPGHVIFENTPDGASWTSLQLRFTNGRTILASFPKTAWNKSIGAGELSLEKRGNQRPKEQWLLLEEAARSNGRISLTTSNRTDKESKRRQINGLQQLLKDVFPNLTGTPFEPTGGDAYQAMFTIEPESREGDDE